MTAMRSPSDAPSALVAGSAFGLSLGAMTLTFPLIALAVGLSPILTGLLATVSGIVQLLTRLILPWLLGRASDRGIASLGAFFLLLSLLVLLASGSLPGFAVAQVLQGAARSLFWTACQAHMIQEPAMASRRLAKFQLACSLGGVAGPASAGFFAAALSLRAGIIVGIASALVCLIATCFMERRTFHRRAPRAVRPATWRTPNVLVGCWASFAAGGWRGALESYVPIVLSTGGFGAGAIGLMTAASDMASVASNAWLTRSQPFSESGLIRASGLVVFVAATIFPFTTGHSVLAAVVLAAGGASSGLVTVLGLSMASGNVDPSERGAAIALPGTYRASARLLSPSVTSAIAFVVPIPIAMSLVGAVMTLPVVLSGRRQTLGDP